MTSLPVSHGRPLTHKLDQIYIRSQDDSHSKAQHVRYETSTLGFYKTLEIPRAIKGRRMMQEALQSSTASATGQGGIITSGSAAQVVSDGNGNVKVAGKATSVVEGAEASQTQASTTGYVSLNQKTDGSVEYVVNSASAASAQMGSHASPSPYSSAQVSGEASTSENGPDAKAAHDASATGTLSASEGIHTVIISQNKPQPR